MDARLNTVYRTLRWTYGLVPVVAGLDKFVGLLADWESYLSPAVLGLSPLSAGQLMAVVGVVEIAAGLVVLAWRPALGAWVVAAWLVLVALQVAAAGFLDIAVRDLVMAVGAFALARLAEVHGDEARTAAAATVAR